ncbi:MAG: hypothetical protein K2M10_02285 [Muribaculaceae bacterium]|nr:hypothetical protein [Muribaculaceae bacterium]
MKYLKLSFIFMLVAFLHATAFSQSRQQQADALYASLKAGMSPKDSINVLYNVFDLTEQDNKSKIGWEILNIADRAEDYEVLYDMIPQMSAIDLQDSEKLQALLQMARRLPDCNHGKAVETYVLVQIATAEGSFLSPQERNKRLVEYLKEDITPKPDKYQNFLDLYRVVVFLGYSHDGNMYMEYLERLGDMIKDLPEIGFGFPSRYYTSAANFYTRNDFPKKAIEADQQLLKLISELEKYYAEKGRKYRDYSRFKYLCYRRMMSNYEGLSRTELEDLYRKCEKLAQDNPELNEDFYQFRMPDAYYFMATGQYDKAVPALESALQHSKTRHVRFKLLRRLQAAADSTNNQPALMRALKDYNQMLEEKLLANTQDAMLELQTRYEIRKLEEERRQAEEAKHEMELEANEKLISIVLIALFALAIILMFLYRSHFSLIHRSRDLKASNDKLHQQIEELLYDGTIL